MPREFDCIVCGEVCVDLPVGPVDRTRPLHSQGTLRIEPIRAGTGGIVSNSGRALAKMGLNTAAFGCVGQDEWADVLTRQLTSLSLPEIGRHFGGRDHSTVLHAIQKVENMVKNDPDFQDTLDRLVKELEGNSHN